MPVSRGILYAIAAYGLWGVFPIYWKQFHGIPALQLLGHRIGWSFLLLLVVILWSKQWGEFRAALTRRNVRIYLGAGLLVAVNWLTYVWAVEAGFIVESSLGYFINPLLSVLLGVIVLRERLRLAQWIAVGLAALGVLYLASVYGRLPWIALTLAISFACYGLVKKIAPLGSLHGVTLETGLLFLPATAYLVMAEVNGAGAFLHSGLKQDVLMFGAGIVTTVPLLLFASAARRIPLSTVGVLQYIAPTMQFLLGVLVYREPFDAQHLIGFAVVWFALIIFWLEGIWHHRLPIALVPELGEG